MRIGCDSEVDALYIRLIEGEPECRTVRLTDEIALNIGPNEQLVGIEVLDAKETLGSGGSHACQLSGCAHTHQKNGHEIAQAIR